MDRNSAKPDVSTVPGDAAKRWVEFHHQFAAPSTYVYGYVWDHSEPAAGPFCTDVAVEFDSQNRRENAIAAALSRGLLTVGCGQKTMRLLPPLDVTEREIELGADLLAESVESVA